MNIQAALKKATSNPRKLKAVQCFVAAFMCLAIPFAQLAFVNSNMTLMKLMYETHEIQKAQAIVAMARHVDPARRDRAIKDVTGFNSYGAYLESVAGSAERLSATETASLAGARKTSVDAGGYVDWIPLMIASLLVMLGIELVREKPAAGTPAGSQQP